MAKESISFLGLQQAVLSFHSCVCVGIYLWHLESEGDQGPVHAVMFQVAMRAFPRKAEGPCRAASLTQRWNPA